MMNIDTKYSQIKYCYWDITHKYTASNCWNPVTVIFVGLPPAKIFL